MIFVWNFVHRPSVFLRSEFFFRWFPIRDVVGVKQFVEFHGFSIQKIAFLVNLNVPFSNTQNIMSATDFGVFKNSSGMREN